MRFIVFPMAVLAISACSPSVPDSAAGVGFGDYNEYQAQQDARARAAAQSSAVSPLPPAGSVSGETVQSGAVGTPLTAINEQQTIAQETAATLAATRANSGVAPVEASPSNPAPQTVETSTGISIENDFEAVDNVRSIESDAALIERNRAQYQVIQPTAVPDRVTDNRPNIVAYALSTSHPVGTQIYNRVGINKQARFERNCAELGSPDRAQMDFLANGGPARDRKGLDPDGDGYACSWNPAPFRNATNG
ncbi:MAG: hypothetical protein AAF641_13115 [Pseudomonadota bacterium]